VCVVLTSSLFLWECLERHVDLLRSRKNLKNLKNFIKIYLLFNEIGRIDNTHSRGKVFHNCCNFSLFCLTPSCCYLRGHLCGSSILDRERVCVKNGYILRTFVLEYCSILTLSFLSMSHTRSGAFTSLSALNERQQQHLQFLQC
jgi:hypothetical protein